MYTIKNKMGVGVDYGSVNIDEGQAIELSRSEYEEAQKNAVFCLHLETGGLLFEKTEAEPDARVALLSQAAELGLNVPKNIGVAKLQEKINAKLAEGAI